ncbi:hypothetical protein BJV78DRAFT_1290470 [Lactifluus subvellereus]|nr:hypothetical protein BJV78DRAFT_1290470 [Lactifluus subvellereus]
MLIASHVFTLAHTQVAQVVLMARQAITPEHQALLSAIGELGAKGITRIDEQLTEQKKADAAAKEKRDDEERSRVEQARLAAERADQDRVEQLRRLDSKRAAFEHAKWELALKEKAFQDAQKSVAGDNDNDGDGNDNDDENDDEGSESPLEQQVGTSKKPTKRELEQEMRHGKLPQVTHSTVAIVLMRWSSRRSQGHRLNPHPASARHAHPSTPTLDGQPARGRCEHVHAVPWKASEDIRERTVNHTV